MDVSKNKKSKRNLRDIIVFICGFMMGFATGFAGVVTIIIS